MLASYPCNRLKAEPISQKEPSGGGAGRYRGALGTRRSGPGSTVRRWTRALDSSPLKGIATYLGGGHGSPVPAASGSVTLGSFITRKPLSLRRKLSKGCFRD